MSAEPYEHSETLGVTGIERLETHRHRFTLLDCLLRRLPPREIGRSGREGDVSDSKVARGPPAHPRRMPRTGTPNT